MQILTLSLSRGVTPLDASEAAYLPKHHQFYFLSMDELREIFLRYEDKSIEEHLRSLESIKEFSGTFYQDVVSIYDAMTRIRNLQRNPTGFSHNDAAILGLLVRIWKILQEIVRYYKEDNGQIISMLDRPVVEAAIIAEYLMNSSDDVIEDYRKCSYKDRLKTLDDTDKPFFKTKTGQRLQNSILRKLEEDGFNINSFEVQKNRDWKLSGKPFRQIFEKSTVVPPDFYKYLYGYSSESIHGSWNESMNFDLRRNDDGTYLAFPFYESVDMRLVTPVIKIANHAFKLWLVRIDVIDENDRYFKKAVQWIDIVNTKIFMAFDDLYVG